MEYVLHTVQLYFSILSCLYGMKLPPEAGHRLKTGGNSWPDSVQSYQYPLTAAH